MPAGAQGSHRAEVVRRTAHDLWCLLRHDSPRAPLRELHELARSRLYAKDDQLVLRKDLRPADAPSPAGALRMERAEARHLPLLAAFNRRQCNTRRTLRFAAALAEGRHGLLGFRDDELVGYFWWRGGEEAAGDTYLARFGIRLAPDEVYGYDFFIAPEHRGRNVPSNFLAGVESELGRLGYRHMLGFVDSCNVPARWLYTIRGYEVVMRCETRTVLRRLMLVDGRAWLAGSRGLRPLTRGISRAGGAGC